MPNRLTPEDFWSRKVIAPCGCWEWTKRRHRDGYGEIGYQRKYWLAHRLAWTLTHGPIEKGLQVLHHCDNPCCINPAHLFVGTQIDNMRDMKTKGRRKRRGLGELNGRAKLTAEQVTRIRSLYERGYTQPDLAMAYRVSQSMISCITRGENWR